MALRDFIYEPQKLLGDEDGEDVVTDLNMPLRFFFQGNFKVRGRMPYSNHGFHGSLSRRFSKSRIGRSDVIYTEDFNGHAKCPLSSVHLFKCCSHPGRVLRLHSNA